MVVFEKVRPGIEAPLSASQGCVQDFGSGGGQRYALGKAKLGGSGGMFFRIFRGLDHFWRNSPHNTV